uniref:RAB43, member RAS oncogene family n=1 Tax=Rattus norvegicus TaxID=10116 RepID=A0A8I5ZL45_RAT
MARNAEKAMTALARFRQAQLEEGKVKERRPFLASECTELPKAEKWRRQIIGEISKKVAQIQNAGLGEFRIRDLNDEINKLLREKGHWEVRIKELGGPDYGKVGPKMLDHEGKEVPGNRGYKYFGAAKDLPGVRELFEKEPLPPPRKTRAELMKAIDFEYYGYLDEDDGVIVPLEQEYEKRLRAELVEKWKAEREARLARGEKEEEEEEEEINIYAVTEEESDEEGSQEKAGEDGQQKFIAHVPVPSQQELQIWDTAGQERFRTITQSYYRSANGAILAYDISKRSTFLSVPHWIEDVRKYAGSNIVQLLIGNKSDLADLREVPLAEAQSLAEHYDILCAIETSAKDSSNVEEAFTRVATELIMRHGGPMFSEKNTDHIQLDSKDIAESWGCGC